jgi:hypothetical protein
VRLTVVRCSSGGWACEAPRWSWIHAQRELGWALEAQGLAGAGGSERRAGLGDGSALINPSWALIG